MTDTTDPYLTGPAHVAGSEEALLEIWQREGTRSMWQDIFDTADTTDDPEDTRRVAAGALADVAGSTPLQALTANADLVKLLTGRRWYVMRDAREHGHTWAEIGAALGISGDDARAYYARKIEAQEQRLAGLHDTARARRVLDEH